MPAIAFGPKTLKSRGAQICALADAKRCAPAASVPVVEKPRGNLPIFTIPFKGGVGFVKQKGRFYHRR